MKTTWLAKAILRLVTVVSSVFGGLLLLAVVILPRDLASRHVYAFSLPGAPWILGFTGVVFLTTGIWLWKSRIRIQRQLEDALIGSSRDCRQLGGAVRQLLLVDRVYFYALVSITLLAALGRMVYLLQPVTYDEAVTLLEFAAESFSAVISDYHVPNNHVFHTLLVYFVYHLFGQQPWVIRLPAFLSGIALIPASYLLAKTLYNKQTGLLTASLVAVSPALMDYSAQARGYTLVTLFFVMMLGLSAYARWQQNRVVWLLLPVLASLGFWTIPVMLYPFGIVILWLFLSNLASDADSLRRATITKRVIISGLFTASLTGVLYLPVFLNSGVGSVVANRFVSPLSWTEFFAQLPASLSSIWKAWTAGLPFLLIIALLLGAIISVVWHRRLASHRVPILLAVIIWCPLVLVLSRAIPYTRVWLFLLPLFLMLASTGLLILFQRTGVLERPRAFAITTVTITLLLLANLVLPRLASVGTPGRTEEIAAFLEQYMEPPDRVLAIVPFDYELLYYFRQKGIPEEHLLDRAHLSGRVLIVADKGQTPEQVLKTIGFFEEASWESMEVVKMVDGAILYETYRAQGPPR